MKAIAITRLGSTLVRKALIVSLAFGVAATSAWGARISLVNADDDDSARVVYRYLSGTGITELGSVCDLGVPCPTAAMAAGGHTVEIVGEGKLSIERKSRRSGMVTGGGSFRHTNSGGDVVAVGTWTARRLLSFESYGQGTGTPPTWEGGIARIRVTLVPDSGGPKRRAILTVSCLLPGIDPSGRFEGAKLNVLGLINFDDAIQPRATLFINLGDERDDD